MKNKFSIPKHISPESRQWVKDVLSKFEFEPWHFKLLVKAGEQNDISVKAQKDLDSNGGITIKDRFGQIRPHPAVGIKRDADVTFCKLIRELGLDLERTPEDYRKRRY